ncbi:hypothetical protein [Gibbsiella dentisursi]|uniref:hypothetical protein n=1 Tax=Gibbsiella dentisursi TaxID=796890 RepID=UPI0031F8EDB6
MSKNKKNTSENMTFIVITNNHFLFKGLVEIFPKIVFYHISPEIGKLHKLDISAPKGDVFILIDSYLFIDALWAEYLYIARQYPNACFIWLTLPQTGGIWSNRFNGHYSVAQKSSQYLLRMRLYTIITGKESRERYRISPLVITTMEQKVIYYFLLRRYSYGFSRSIGINLKSFYFYRRRIMTKMGFISPAFMGYILQKNKEFLFPNPREC